MLRRPGVTRADVLIATLGLVVTGGLLLAAVSRVREAAAAMTCQNNLRQVALATRGYSDTYDRLPPLVDQGVGARTGRGLPSLFATLMPYIEATPELFRPERPPHYYHAHSSVVITYRGKENEPIEVDGGMANSLIRFQDPADEVASQRRDIPMTLPDGTTGHYATGSYAANGLLPWGTRTMAEAFPRGAANTILIGERPQVCRTAAGEEVYNLWGLGIYSPHMPAFAALTPSDPPGLLNTGQAAPVRPLPGDELIRVRIGRHDTEPVTPDFTLPVQVIRAGRACDPRLPGTPHRRGMQAAMADGSVRVFAPDTTLRVFWAACDPASPPGDP
jgi:hypothetical protein